MDVTHFFVTGINYKKTDAVVRGQYAIHTDTYASILEKAPAYGIQEAFIISTCNRTEMYGVTDDASKLIRLICTETGGDEPTFRNLSYTRQGYQAIDHLWQVAAGLDSQILGDYEIVGQMKAAVKFARDRNFTGTFTERIISGALAASKAIRTQTEISGGTVSVSFAAIQYLKSCVADIGNKKILLIGTGKIGRNTCRNIIDYLGNRNITLMNRTPEKALALAEELQIASASYEELEQQSKAADIIIVSTNSSEPVLRKEHFTAGEKKVLIDLSIPNNIEVSVKELPFITLVNVDDLSRINDATLQKRMAEVPKAKAILTGHMQELKEWCTNRRHVPFLKAAKQKMMDMQDCSILRSKKKTADITQQPVNTEAIQKVINTMAVKMRCINQPGCNYIEAINDYIDGSN